MNLLHSPDQSAPAAPYPSNVQPVRAMGRWSLTAVGISGIIGAGIYTLPSTLAGSLGASSVPAYVVAAAIVLIFGHSLAVLGRSFEQTGGPYVYVTAVLGDFWGFLVGWSFFLARLTALGAVTNVFVAYLARFVPACGAGLGRAVAIIVCLGALTALNVAGIRNTSLAMNLFALGKVLPLAAFAVAGAFFADSSRLSLSAAPEASAFGRGVLLLIFAFGGFEFLTVPAEESRRPTETVPFALFASIATSSALFISVQAVALAVAPDLARHPDALSHAAERFAGAAGAVAMAAGAAIATTGTNLAVILVTSRMLYAFARDGRVPRALGTLSARFRTPVLAIVLTGAMGVLLAVTGSFAHLAALSAAARLVTYGTSCAAVVRLRATRKTGAVSLALPSLGALLALALFALLSKRELLLAGLAAVTGAAVYFAGRAKPSSRGEI